MSVPFTQRTRIVVSTDQVSAPVADEMVILAMKDAVYYGLDSVRARIWALIQEPRDLGEIATILESEYDVTHDRVLADVVALATSLRDRGLIEVLPAATLP